jgi:hypothetical protein
MSPAAHDDLHEDPVSVEVESVEVESVEVESKDAQHCAPLGQLAALPQVRVA